MRCYFCDQIIKDKYVRKTITEHSGHSGIAFSFGLGKRNKGTTRMSTGRNYYRNKTVRICEPCNNRQKERDTKNVFRVIALAVVIAIGWLVYVVVDANKQYHSNNSNVVQPRYETPVVQVQKPKDICDGVDLDDISRMIDNGTITPEKERLYVTCSAKVR